MTNELREEVLSSNFPAYRKAEIEVAASFVNGLRTVSENFDYCRGALDMFRKIMNIPRDVASTPELKQMIGQRMETDFREFEVEYLRKAVRYE
jgi:hypothetical protein